MACEPCPVGSACVGTGNTLAFLPLAKGYYRASMDSLDLRKCPDFNSGNGSACIGGSFYQSCRPWTTGPYCRLCNVSDSSRYYDSSKSECLPCEGSTTMPLVTLAVITVSVLLLFCWCGWRKPYNRVPSHIRNRWFKLGHQLVSTLRAPAKQMIAFYQASPCMTPNHPMLRLLSSHGPRTKPLLPLPAWAMFHMYAPFAHITDSNKGTNGLRGVNACIRRCPARQL